MLAIVYKYTVYAPPVFLTFKIWQSQFDSFNYLLIVSIYALLLDNTKTAYVLIHPFSQHFPLFIGKAGCQV